MEALMNRRRNALILIACALVLAIGAYILFTDSKQEETVVRQEVAPPAETATAPSWVDTGQSAEPDYSSAASETHNATPKPKQSAPKVIEVSENTMVSFTFVESLADFMLIRFMPQDKNGMPATLASAKSLNMYYGQELDGFSVRNDDIQLARKSVLDYAFTPTMIKSLYELYTPVLMEHIVETAANDEREYKNGGQASHRTLSDAETGVMLKLNADRIEQTSAVFRTIANDPSITDMAGKYLQAAKAVERSNVQLQNAIADEKSTSTPSARLKQAIIQREQIKKAVIERLKEACSDCSNTELFYLAQWSYRRVLSEPDKQLPTFEVAAEVLDDLAKQFRTAADELK